MRPNHREEYWLRHHGPIRAFVEGIAQGFAADPEHVYTGREVEHLLRANLDLADAQHDRFDLGGIEDEATES